ncbi:hemophore-related protein [Mycobacteroides abscessus]|uniref:hemophore-related protein n=1 Tax=Mycobacteroides abscessus TaxID=36809 RepID=UPI00355B5855
MGWDTSYPYDWDDVHYWNYWYPTWTQPCPWRCPTNDNGPYPPDVQAYLHAHPDLDQEFDRVHQFPWEQRRAQIQPFLDSHPDIRAWFDNRQPWI